MNLDLSLVPYGHVHEVYPAIVPYLVKGQEWTLGKASIDDLSAQLFRPSTLLWIVFDQDSKKITGYLATEIQQFPQARHFVVLHCGGEDGTLEATVHKVFDTFEQYAQQSGCDGLEFVGRPAWAKFVRARGYEQPQRLYYKNLRE